MKVYATPGYLDAVKRQGLADLALFVPGIKALGTLVKGGEPSWVVGDPEVKDGRCIHEDEGRTLKIRAPFRFYAIRDDHPEGCDCGCGGGSVVTYLLPKEY